MLDLRSADAAKARPISVLQIRIFAICSLVVFFDGFDTQAIGYVAPLLAKATNAPLSSFGAVFSIGLAGAVLGAFIFGPLGDRFGRRWLLIGASAIFAAFSLFTMFVTSLPELLIVRFLTGVGLGGAVPTSLALVSEYSPQKFRGLAITAMFSAFPLGGFVGGLVASALISQYGWQSVFLVGGIVPAISCIALVLWVPESIQYLAMRGKKEQLSRLVAQLAPGDGPAPVMATPVESMSFSVFKEMLTKERLRMTLLLWVPFFLGFMVILTVVLWGPSLLREAGIPLSTAALVFAVHYFGGFVGTAFCGYFVDKFGPLRVLVPGFLIGAACVGAFGFLTSSIVLLCIDAFLCGVLLVGSSNGLLPVAASLYPTHLRSTGIGWAMGAGRCGQLVGPVLVGLMLSASLQTSTIFLMAVGPCLVAAAFVFLLARSWGNVQSSRSPCDGEPSLRPADI